MDNEERMKKLLQAICKPVTPSPGFKERLLRRLTQEVSRRGLPIPRRLWLKPVLWAPIAAFVALALIGYFVLVPLVLAPVAPPPVTPPAPSPTPPVTPAPTVVSTGIVEIRVTDAPAEQQVSAINVTITNIQVHKADGDQGWVTIIEEPNSFDLLQLRGVEKVLGAKESEVGHYTQIRMDVEPVAATVDGKDVDVDVVLPSGRLKLVGSFDVESSKKTILTLDFDADKSLVFTGEGKIIFKPVVKLIVTYED